MASFHVRSEVCIAPFYERIKVGKFALHIDGSNSDFAPHMEGINIELQPNFFANYKKNSLNKLYCRSLYDLRDHFWEYKYFEGENL